MDGTINVDAEIGEDMGTNAGYECGGGGSGGSVYITADTLSGSGTITADGGRGGNNTVTTTQSGGGSGAGGRIALHYDTSTFDFTGLSVTGGISLDNAKEGYDGSIALIDVDDSILTVLEGFIWHESDGFNGTNSYSMISITNAILGRALRISNTSRT